MQSQTAKVLDGGRIILPVEFRAAMGVAPGDRVVLELNDGELRIRSRRLEIERARAELRQFIPEGVSLVEELMADRRAEAERE